MGTGTVPPLDAGTESFVLRRVVRFSPSPAGQARGLVKASRRAEPLINYTADCPLPPNLSAVQAAWGGRLGPHAMADRPLSFSAPTS